MYSLNLLPVYQLYLLVLCTSCKFYLYVVVICVFTSYM